MEGYSFCRIKGEEDKYYKQFLSVYKSSFPVFEQRSQEQQSAAFKNNSYCLVALVKGDKLASFISYWEFDDYIYIEHLAVNSELRGQNIGSFTLSKFAQNNRKILLLEIDPLVDEVSKRRLCFYKKLGYKVNPYHHHHPAYRQGYDSHELLVLSLSEVLSENMYNRFYSDLVQVVMNAD
ncbi:GNAT family N-acetyltransferase [Dysgonomonas sp. BGC7]|uniref:GNAT family N-acetyltransferase n=1 Tax=Dysgonomonas sp. BGC7 TaxID=1658008 RepID=UPI00067FE30F|nr:GNAT family N-acetyltransferase [Dysgonomonas sp. BGC7]MBD8390308.1 GNAT family N-acetyltransferase [Dysgonomonas sp. BGC7]